MSRLQPLTALASVAALVATIAGCERSEHDKVADRGTNDPSLHRMDNGVRQQAAPIPDQSARSEGAAADSGKEEGVESVYAEINGIWSDNPSCAPRSGYPIHISVEGIDFGHSHFHVDSGELRGSELRLHGHYITQGGAHAGNLSVALIGRSPVQRLQILSKTYVRCP